MPDVSVVIPTHSRAGRLRRTLAAVLAQEEVELEVVVVDDGSTDETAAFLDAHPDPRVRPLHHPAPTGVAVARNDGLAAAGGEWVAFLDDDDLWSPRKLATQLAAASPGVDWVYGPALVVDDRFSVLGLEDPPAPGAMPQELLRFNAVPAGCSNVIARRSLLERTGGFDVRLKMLADWEMWLRLSAHGRPGRGEGREIAYVKHDANMHLAEVEVVASEIEVLRERYPLDVDEVWLSRYLAGALRRGGRRGAAVRTYLQGAVRARSAGNVVRALGVLGGEGLIDRLRPGRPDLPPAPAWLTDLGAG